jgi:hypothetical protein
VQNELITSIGDKNIRQKKLFMIKAKWRRNICWIHHHHHDTGQGLDGRSHLRASDFSGWAAAAAFVIKIDGACRVEQSIWFMTLAASACLLKSDDITPIIHDKGGAQILAVQLHRNMSDCSKNCEPSPKL